MLAGLIFATEAADDRADVLAATLPFGGMTLLEYQARLLIAAGVGHVVVAVARVTPALLGAVSRIGRRGVAVDVVRSAEEAVAKVHPLATLIVLADALVTTDVVVTAMAGEAPGALLVTNEEGQTAAVERVDADHCWAGVATVLAERLGDVAAFPREYDFQSTLLRVAVQGGARHVPLPASARRAGHGVERNAVTLASRSNAVLAALANQRIGWADRYVFTPITRIALPWLVRQGVPDWAVVGSGATIAALALVLVALGHPVVGVIAALIAVAVLSTSALLSWLCGDDRHARWQEWAIGGIVALIMLMSGGGVTLAGGGATAAVLGLVAVATGAIVERVPVRRRMWFASAPSGLLLLAPFVLAGVATIGLGLVAAYSLLTLAVAVETVRKNP